MKAGKTPELEQGEQVAQHEQPDKNGKGKHMRLERCTFEQINAQKGKDISAYIGQRIEFCADLRHHVESPGDQSVEDVGH